MLLVEIGTDMDAFGSADRLASRICPGNNESAGKRKSGYLTFSTSAKAAGSGTALMRAC